MPDADRASKKRIWEKLLLWKKKLLSRLINRVGELENVYLNKWTFKYMKVFWKLTPHKSL